MNVEKEAIKILAESLVKACGNITQQNNRSYVNNQIKNGVGGGANGGSWGGNYTGSINVSQIRGFGAAAGAAGVNAVSAEFGLLTADTALIENLFAQYGRFTNLVADHGTIGTIDTEAIYSDLADIGISKIGTATIMSEQVQVSSVDTAFIRQGVGNKYYIDNLAVTEGNIVSLSVGQLMIRNTDGEMVRLVADGDQITTEPVTYDGDVLINDNSLDGTKVVNGSISGSKLIAETITTRELNVSELFAQNAVIMDLIAANIDAVKLFANEGFIPQLTTTIISSEQIGEGINISHNSTIEITNERIDSIVSTNNRKNATFIQESTPESYNAGDIWFKSSERLYYISTGATGKDSPVFAQDDYGRLVYSFADEADETYNLTVDSNGDLCVEEEDHTYVADEVAPSYSIVDNDFVCVAGWVLLPDQAISEIDQQANKITWLVQEGTSKSNMVLTSEMLDLVTQGISISVQQIAIEAVNTLIRIDDDGLHVGDVNSDKEVLINDESMNIVIAGETYSKFGSNYAQFGNYRIYNDSTGGLAFKMI